MTIYTVSSGSISTGLHIKNGSELDVLSGGMADGTSIMGGSANDYGAMIGTTIHEGILDVYAGGSAFDTVVDETTAEFILSGGKSYFDSVNGGTMFVDSGGESVGATISSGGNLDVGNGAEEIGTTIKNHGATSFDGGTGVGITVENGGYMTMMYGDAYDTVIEHGGQEDVGGAELGDPAGEDFDATIAGYQAVGGIADGAVIKSGGEQFVTISGMTSGTKIESGGVEIVGNDDDVAVTTKIAGGELDLQGGVASKSITFTGKGGTLFLDGFTSSAPTAIISGFVAGDEIMFSYFEKSADVSLAVTKPGVLTVSSGGLTYNLKIAGAKVGSTAYQISSGVLTTTVAPAAMDFLRPAKSDAAARVFRGGNELPALPRTASAGSSFVASVLSRVVHEVGGLPHSVNVAHSAVLVGLQGDGQKGL